MFKGIIVKFNCKCLLLGLNVLIYFFMVKYSKLKGILYKILKWNKIKFDYNICCVFKMEIW